MKKSIVRGLIALAVCVVVLTWAWSQVAAAGEDLQYLIPAPQITVADPSSQQGSQTDPDAGGAQDGQQPQKATPPNQAVQQLWESFQTTAADWDGIMRTYTLSGVAEKTSMTGDTGETKQARLTAIGDNAFTLTPEYVQFGRLFYPEELSKGCNGILLDEQLALALFKISEPIGRTVTISNVEFTVLGVIRHSLRVGDGEDYGALVTLPYLWNQPIQLQALQATARPLRGAGARSAFSTAMQSWKAGGTLIDLGKEGMGALMPIRVLLFTAGCVLFFTLLGFWNGWTRRFAADYRRRLEGEYAVRLLPRLLAAIVGLLAGYALLAAGAAALVTYIVEPVYTFTEWVPAVLVEWKDIRTAFWQVWQGAASLQELRNPELCRIRYFAMVIGWFGAGAAILLAVLWYRIRLEYGTLKKA